jgi:hypothetical protein
MGLPTRGLRGFFSGVCPPQTWEFLFRANYLPKSKAGLHMSWKRAMVYALPQIKLCWTGREVDRPT